MKNKVQGWVRFKGLICLKLLQIGPYYMGHVEAHLKAPLNSSITAVPLLHSPAHHRHLYGHRHHHLHRPITPLSSYILPLTHIVTTNLHPSIPA